LRSARLRAGWTREALAYHSGLTWAAVAQIESGRRQDVRLSSLTALAGALGVTVDYLVGGQGTVGPNLLEHRVLVYGSEKEFAASLVPFVAEGAARSDAVLVVTTAPRVKLLRRALKDDARNVEFVDSTRWYRTPCDTVSRYKSFIAERFARGASWIRIIGEPPLHGRSDDEVAEWTRYEALLNVSFASSPATIVCPYDSESLPYAVVAGARHTHPTLAAGERISDNPDYEAPEPLLMQGHTTSKPR
jgi:transcriptional regulator with XRE-family HTH domain